MTGNKHYRKGYTFENYLQNFFTDKGYHVTRSAGSHGHADLVIIPPIILFTKTYLAQAKATKKELKEMTKAKRIEFYNYCTRYGAEPLLLIKTRKNKANPTGFYSLYLSEIYNGNKVTHL